MTLQINTSTGARDLTTNEQAEVRTGLAAAAAADLSAHASSTSNPHGVTKTQVGLGNVDNTADADKPVSTAQAVAIGAAVTAHIDAADPHPGKYAAASHTHTPASIGAATAAQGTKADTAIQPGAQLTQAAVTATTAAGVALLGAADATAQRAALGLGTAATSASTAFATAAQGAKADTALQPGALPAGTTLPAAQVSDSSASGRTVMTGTAAAGLTALGGLGNSAGAIATTLEGAATTAPADLARIQASVSGHYAGNLRDWVNYTGARKLALVGDSTTYLIEITAQNKNYLDNAHRLQPGSALYGVTVQYFGANGNTLSNFLANGPAGYGILDVIAASPTADGAGYGIELRYGINDIRLQASGNTASTLASMLKQAINQIRAALPKVSIVLRCPNSFLTTDVGGFGYVVPNSWAQGASDALRDAYNSLAYQWDNVVVRSLRTNLFPDTCPAASSSMTDQLHPSVAPGGFKGIIDEIAGTWSVAAQYKSGLAKDAQAVSYTNDFLTYPLVVENGVDYDLITSGAYSGSGSGYLDFAGDLTKIGGFRTGDVVLQNRQIAFAIPHGNSQSLSGANIRLGNLGGSLPNAQVGGVVSVYRRRYASISVGSQYVGKDGGPSPAYPYTVRCSIVTGSGANYARLTRNPGDPLSAAAIFGVRATDTMLHPILGAVPLTGATFNEFSVDAVQISLSGRDFSITVPNYEVFVVGAAARVTTQPDITFQQPGTLTSGTLRYINSVGGIWSSCTATLGTAGSVATTVVIARNGTTVATITFAIGATAGTIAWAAGASFCALPGRTFTAAVTAGAGAADLAIAIGF